MAQHAAGRNGSDLFERRSMPLTEARIDQARRLVRDGELDTDKAGRRSWRDDGCQGLVLTVNASTGSGQFYFQGTVNGKTVRRALGDADAVRLDEAREAVGRLRYDRSTAAALAPRSEQSAKDGSATVGDVVAEMLDAHEAGRWLPGTRSRKPTDRTMKFYRDLRRAQLSDHERLTLAEFAERLPNAYATLQSKAPIQGNRFLQLVRNLYAYATDGGLWNGTNPAVGTSKTNRLTRTTEQPRTRTLTDQEWNRLAKALEADSPLWRDLFSISLLTLQRMGACTHMRWADLELSGKNAAWTIPAEWMKGRKSGHVVPLAEIPEAVAILKARRAAVAQDCLWVFPGSDSQPARNYDKAWERVIRAAKLWHEDNERRPRPHDLRRTGGARMTAAGVPLQTVTHALGDAPSSTGMVARVYAQVVDEALRDAFAVTSRRQRRRR